MARTRQSVRAPSLARLFTEDPLGAVLTVLRDAGSGAPLRAEEIKRALADRGVPADRLAAWRGIQARLVADPRVDVGGDRYRRTYRYVPQPPRPSPQQALALLAGHRIPAARRAELAAIVGAALGDGPRGRDRDLREREQREKEIVRVLAELAIEVEELATNQASTRALIHAVRNRTRSAMLEPVERAGEATHFDRARHQPVGGAIADGAPVVVLRPGYVWNGPDGKILVARAVVQDRGRN